MYSSSSLLSYSLLLLLVLLVFMGMSIKGELVMGLAVMMVVDVGLGNDVFVVKGIKGGGCDRGRSVNGIVFLTR